MADVDTILSESFKRVAEPGDPTGVAELIRARVAAGDTGTPSNGGTGFAGGGWTWLPWVGAGIVVAIAGAVVGASGLFGSLQPTESAPAPSMPVAVLTSGLDCPGGSAVVAFRPGDRVLAVARSEDSAYLAVRSPFDRADRVWVPVSDLVIDAGEPDVASLEVDGCPVPVVTVAAPEQPTEAPEPPAPPAPPASQPPAPPQPPTPDTTPPTLGSPSGVQSIGCTPGYGTKPDSTTITIQANDNKAVAGVSISWAGQDSGGGSMTKSGSNWTFSYNPPDTTNGNVTFTMVAHDAAGNQSTPKSFVISVECLI